MLVKRGPWAPSSPHILSKKMKQVYQTIEGADPPVTGRRCGEEAESLVVAGSHVGRLQLTDTLNLAWGLPGRTYRCRRYRPHGWRGSSGL